MCYNKDILFWGINMAENADISAPNGLIPNLGKLHTTAFGVQRIKKAFV